MGLRFFLFYFFGCFFICIYLAIISLFSGFTMFFFWGEPKAKAGATAAAQFHAWISFPHLFFLFPADTKMAI
jgi:hypothetical protein